MHTPVMTMVWMLPPKRTIVNTVANWSTTRKQGVERDERTSDAEQLHQGDAARPFPAYGNQD